MTAPYKTLRRAASDEFIIHKSRFIGYASPAQSEEESLAFLQSIRTKHKDATHNCYAYVIGRNAGVMRYSDDGEPGGTAGLPMMEVLKAQGVVNCCVVVTRYFGGVLLGAGGLLRAYTKSAKDALDAAGISVVRRWVEAELPCSYAMAERLKLEVAAFDGIVTGMDYAASVTIKALVPEEKAEDFKVRIFDLSAGAVSAALTGEAFRAVPLK